MSKPIVVVVEDDVVVDVVVVLVAPVVVVVVLVACVVVVVVAPGQTQPGWHSSIAPPGELGGQVRLPGGSHCSPGSTLPSPHAGAIVVVVVVVTVVVVVVVAPGHTQPGWHSSMAPPGELGGQVRLPGGSHCSPGSSVPLPHVGGAVVVVVVGAVVDVVDGWVPVVVVVVAAQPPGTQASQQLVAVPTQAVPSFGGRHEAALRLMLHLVLPCLSVRQHVTAPSLPHVDLAAHSITVPLHSSRRSPSATAASATRATHLT
jgi:hypothetical protein